MPPRKRLPRAAGQHSCAPGSPPAPSHEEGLSPPVRRPGTTGRPAPRSVAGGDVDGDRGAGGGDDAEVDEAAADRRADDAGRSRRVQSVGPAKRFPSAASVSVPIPPDIDTHKPGQVRVGAEQRLDLVAPGRPAVPRSICDRSLPAADRVVGGQVDAVEHVGQEHAVADPQLGAAVEPQPVLGVPPGDEPVDVLIGAAPGASKIRRPAKKLPLATPSPARSARARDRARR